VQNTRYFLAGHIQCRPIGLYAVLCLSSVTSGNFDLWPHNLEVEFWLTRSVWNLYRPYSEFISSFCDFCSSGYQRVMSLDRWPGHSVEQNNVDIMILTFKVCHFIEQHYNRAWRLYNHPFISCGVFCAWASEAWWPSLNYLYFAIKGNITKNK